MSRIGEGPAVPVRLGPRGVDRARHRALSVCVIVAAACMAGSAMGPGASAAPLRPGITATSGTPASRQRTSTTSSGPLSVSLTVAPVRAAPGAAVEFNVGVADQRATGALGYVLRFGDGSVRANPLPMFCLAGPGSPESGSWRFAHRYSRAGTYRASVTGFANCWPARATTTVTVKVI